MINVSPSIVRVASQVDRVEVWRLFLQAYQENGLFRLAIEKVDWFLTRALQPETISPMDTGPRGVIGVIGPPNQLEAICFLAISETWYSQEKHLGDYLVFVDPEFRRSNHFKTLIEWMQIQSKETGLPLLTGVVSTERTESKCKLYRRIIPKVGEFFLWRPQVSSVVGSSLSHVAA